MADYIVQNPPTNLKMFNFRAIADDYGGLVKSCRFAVQIRPVGEYLLPYSTFCRDFVYLCEVAEMPGRGFMNIDVRYYGPNHKLPFQSSYEDLNLTFLCRTQSIERQFFDDWMFYVNPTNSFDFNYRDQYRSEIDIFQLSDYSEDDTDEPTAQYAITIHNAFPILVNPQPMSWADDQFQRLVISFTYTHWTRRGYDPQPGVSPLVEGRTVIR